MINTSNLAWGSHKEKIIEKYGPWVSYDVEHDGSRFVLQKKPGYNPLDPVFLAQVVNSTDTFLKKPWHEIRVLDLACMEGLSSMEFAKQGAKEVVGIEGRESHVTRAEFTRSALAIDNVKFYQDDIRNISKSKYGTFDVVLCLGILYHLNTPDLFTVVENMFEMTDGLAIIDTHFVFRPKYTAEFKGETYGGNFVHEHLPSFSQERKLQSFEFSLDNNKSFWLTRESLFNLLINVGFTSLFRCTYPRGGNREVYDDRITLIAHKNPLLQLQVMVNDQGSEHFTENDGNVLHVSPFHPVSEK